MKVLIAEDDAISRMIFKKSVKKFGHECLTAEAEVSSTRIASSGSRLQHIHDQLRYRGGRGRK